MTVCPDTEDVTTPSPRASAPAIGDPAVVAGRWHGLIVGHGEVKGTFNLNLQLNGPADATALKTKLGEGRVSPHGVVAHAQNIAPSDFVRG